MSSNTYEEPMGENETIRSYCLRTSKYKSVDEAYNAGFWFDGMAGGWQWEGKGDMPPLCDFPSAYLMEEEEEEELKCVGFRPQTRIGECAGCKNVCEECEPLMIVEEEDEERFTCKCCGDSNLYMYDGIDCPECCEYVCDECVISDENDPHCKTDRCVECNEEEKKSLQ
jgi:hypothetical protein